MYQSRTSIAVLVLAFFALLGMASAPARADGAFTGSYPVSGQIYDFCTGETVTLSGDLHYVVKVTSNEDGTYTYRAHMNLQDVHGVGDVSGLKYVLANNYHQTQTSAPGSVSSSTRETFRLLSQGSADNEYISARFAYTYDFVTNKLTVKFDEFRFECRG